MLYINAYYRLQAILNDSIIRMVKKTYPNNKVDYYKAMWRGSQLYAVSCAYSVMAVLAGKPVKLFICLRVLIQF